MSASIDATAIEAREAAKTAAPTRADATACCIYAVLVAVFFWQVLFLPDVQMPKGGGDLASFLYPTYAFAADQIQRGVFPLWNPHLFAGAPFAADVQSGLYYPPSLIAFLLARPFTYQAIEALAIFHFLLAAIFAYLCARGFGLGARGSFAAGLIFGFGGFATAHLAHLNMLAAAVWLPLIVFLLHRAIQRASLGWSAAAGVAFGVSVLAGHTQISLYTFWFIIAYWLWALTSGWRFGKSGSGQESPPASPASRSTVLSLPVCLAVAFGLAAVQLLPLAELLRYSLRSEVAYAKAVEFGASPLGLITLFVPHFFGDNPGDYWGLRWSLTEAYGYAGIATWLLLAVALLVGRPWRRWVTFFAITAVLALLLSMAEHTALYGLLYRFVPGFDKVRAPGRLLLFFDFALAMLAAAGVDTLCFRLRRRWRPAYSSLLRWAGAALGASIFLVAPVFYYALMTSQDKDPAIFRRLAVAIDSFNLSVVFLAVGLCLLIVHRRLHLRLIPYAFLALLALDLFSANGTFNPTSANVVQGFDHPAIVGYLRKEAGSARIDSATGIADLWQPDTALLHRLSDIRGLFNPLSLADYERYWESLGSRSVPGYDLLAAGFLVGRKDVDLDRDKFTLVFDGDPELSVYRNTAALPRATLVSRGEAMPGEEQLARLKSKDFDPRRVVLLEPGTVLQPASDLPGKILDVRYPSSDRIAIDVDSVGPSYLLLSEIYYPGWQASVDGREVPVLRADYTFRAIALAPGSRQVNLVFAPKVWRYGLAITALTALALLACGAAWARSYLRRRQ